MTKKLLALFLLSLLALTFPSPHLLADTQYYEDDYPYHTYTVDFEGYLTYTQTAYAPLGVLNPSVSLDNPQDLYVKDGLVYVADTDNGRIAVIDYDGTLVLEIGDGILTEPSGVFVSEEGFVYVADKANEFVYKFATDGTFVRSYGRPVEPLFGANSLFIPTKVVVGSGENIYVIGDGSTSGVIQLNYDGSFLGYYGVNLSSKSFLQQIADLFVVTDEYAGTTPPSPTNIAINSKSLVYTATPNTVEALKKLDINGNNILSTINYNQEASIVDLTVDELGYVTAIYNDGFIVEYEPSGNLLFAFDVVQTNAQVLGMISNPSAIQIDEAGYLFVADQATGDIVIYRPSDFATLVHQAIDLYQAGDYLESEVLFEAIIKQNANFALAHSALGKAYYQAGRMADSLSEYLLASDVAGYSDTYWQIRDAWLNEHLNQVFLWVLFLMVVSWAFKIIRKRTKVFAPVTAKIAQISGNPRVRAFTLLFQVLKHPINSYYEIKREHRAGYPAAFTILFVLFLEYLAMIGLTGFIFNRYSDQINLVLETLKFFGVFALFVFTNYLISTLSDGEGWFKDVFVGIAYALSPLVFGIPFLIILSNVLTQNESILYSLFSFILVAWSLVLVYLAVKEIHNYEIMETVKNLLMTIFAMFILLLIGFIVYVFGSQLWDFLASWIKEAINRVF